MTTKVQRMRQQIERLVTDRLIEQGGARLKDLEWPEPLCPLVNPLCPDDLCVLPAEHVGADAGLHVLGTTPYDRAERYPLEWMRPVGTSRAELVDEGARLAKLMFESTDE